MKNFYGGKIDRIYSKLLLPETDIIQERTSFYAKNPLLERDNGKLNFDSITDLKDGKTIIEMQKVQFSVLFRRSTSKYLWVFLSNLRDKGGKRRYPIFVRNSYVNLIEDSVLCVDDPTYYYNKQIRNGWYIGDKDTDYASTLATLIQAVAKSLSIENNGIIIMGSSSGGTAAIHIASCINAANYIAINPQLLPFESEWTITYHQDTGLSLKQWGNRTDTLQHIKIVDNTHGKGLIIYNICQKSDKTQALLLSNVNNTKFTLGLNKYTANSFVWLYDVEGIPGSSDPHGLQETRTIFFAINLLIKQMLKHETIPVELYDLLTEMWNNYYSAIANSTLDAISSKINNGDKKGAYQILRDHRGNKNAIRMLQTHYSTEDLIEIRTELAFKHDLRAIIDLYRMYYSGEGVPVNYDEASKWLSKAIVEGAIYLSNNIPEMMEKNISNESQRLMIDSLIHASKLNDSFSSYTLGQYYSKGNCVKKDLEKSAEYYHKALKLGYGRSLSPLCDVLIELDSPDSTKQMVELITDYGEKDNSIALVRLFWIYRDGTGVSINLQKSAEYGLKAINLGQTWLRPQYMDVLVKINTKSSLESMVCIGESCLDSSDHQSLLRLARAYRYGLGTERNIKRAAEIYKKCITLGNELAKDELFSMVNSNTLRENQHK